MIQPSYGFRIEDQILCVRTVRAKLFTSDEERAILVDMNGKEHGRRLRRFFAIAALSLGFCQLSGCFTMGVWSWGTSTDREAATFEVRLVGIVPHPDRLLFDLRSVEGFDDGVHAVEISSDWKRDPMEKMWSFYRLDSLVTTEFEPYSGDCALQPVPRAALGYSEWHEKVGRLENPFVWRTVRAPPRSPAQIWIWAYLEEEEAYVLLLKLRPETSHPNGRRVVGQVKGLDLREDERDRIVIDIHDYSGEADGLFSIEVPDDWRSRPRHAAALTYRLASPLSLHAKPVSADLTAEAVPIATSGVVEWLSGKDGLDHHYFYQRNYPGTDYEKSFELWAHDRDRKGYILLGRCDFSVESWLTRWYGPAVATLATPVAVVLDVLLLPFQPQLIEHMVPHR